MSFVTSPIPRGDQDLLVTEIESQMQRIQQAISDIERSQLRRATVPDTPASPGRVGQIAADTTHLYVCVDTDTWRRAALSTW